MSHLSWSLLMLGQVDDSIDMIDQSLAEARKINHHHSLALALHSDCFLATWLRDAKRLWMTAQELLALCDEHGFAFYRSAAMNGFGAALSLEGRYEEAIANFKEGIAGYRAADAGYLVQSVLGELPRWDLKLGVAEESAALLDEALLIVEENEERSDQPIHLLLKGEIALARDEGLDVAVSHITRGHDLARRQKALWWELRLTVCLARLYADSGRRDEAVAKLQPVYASFTSGFQTRDLIEAKQLLDSLQ